VANGADGKLRIYDGDSFKLLNAVDIGEDADNVRYDPAEKKVYVAFGSSPLSSKRTQIITGHWQKVQRQSERVRACGMRNETGSI
jgi:DNA-binding beta-propeller fold protein YncE